MEKFKRGSAFYQAHACMDREWAIVHRCKRCGHLSPNRIAADDNPLKLMSIAVKPLAEPPFPLEELGPDACGGQASEGGDAR